MILFVCFVSFCFLFCSVWLFHPFSVRREKFLTPRDRLFMLLFYLDNKSNLAYEYTNWKVRGVREMRYPFVFTQVQSATSLPVLLASFCLFFGLFPGFFFLRPPFPSLLPLSLPHPSPFPASIAHLSVFVNWPTVLVPYMMLIFGVVYCPD